MDRAAAELALASLWVEESPERLEALRNAAQVARDWEGLGTTLARHGVLALFLRNLAKAGHELPPALAPGFQAQAGQERQEDQRARLTLTRFLAACARRKVEVTPVGGTALAFEGVEPELRRLGEPELLVAPEHQRAALEAGVEAGLLLEERALPPWWHRRTGLPLVLRPSSHHLGALRLGTVLHHPSLLLTTREPEVLARRRKTSHGGHPLHLLEPIDALLELCVHVATRAGERLVSGRSHLLAAAGAPAHALRLDQVLDVRATVERLHGEIPSAQVLTRAREWGALAALGAVLECVQMGLGFLPGPREWARQVVHGAAAATRDTARALFRPDPIERLPQWLRPSDACLSERQGLPPGASVAALRRARARHLAQVLGGLGFAALSFPAALAARQLARGARRAAWAAAERPERLSDVAEAFQAASRVEQMKPVTPRSIQLPTKDESVSRFPDHYRG